MASWGAEVKAGEDYVHCFSKSFGRLRITQATLGDLSSSGWSVLESKAGQERRAIICALNPSTQPMSSLEIELEEDVDTTFFVNGQSSIFLSGYYIHPRPNTCTASILHPSRNKNKVVEKPSGIAKNNVYHEVSDDDDEMETDSQYKESDKLAIECIIEGQAGAEIATLGSKVKVEYIGHSKDGKFIDHGNHYQFKLGAKQVIRGWELGIEGMRVGEQRKLTIPPSLGYGDKKQEKIPPNSWLVYIVKLFQVVQNKRTPEGSTEE